MKIKDKIVLLSSSVVLSINGWDDAQDGTLKYYILRRNGLSS